MKILATGISVKPRPSDKPELLIKLEVGTKQFEMTLEEAEALKSSLRNWLKQVGEMEKYAEQVNRSNNIGKEAPKVT